jgi:hypothetical protein
LTGTLYHRWRDLADGSSESRHPQWLSRPKGHNRTPKPNGAGASVPVKRQGLRGAAVGASVLGGTAISVRHAYAVAASGLISTA